jgi:peptidyl-prolyl cis-trans isomerase D
MAKKVLWVISAIIIISFGFGFGYSRFSGDEKMNATAGKVFGEKISFKDFKKYADEVRDQAILMHGDSFQKVLPYVDMDAETWTRIMLIKEAERQKVKAADPEVIAFIVSVPVFQKEGEFDKKLYNMLLAQVFRRDPRDFEESVRDQIKVMKLMKNRVPRTIMTETEIRQEYEQRNKKTRVQYVLIDPKTFSGDVPAEEKDLKDFFDSRRQDFQVPESVNIQYVTVPLKEKASDEDQAAAEKKAADVRQALADKGDFDAIAKAAQLDIKKTGFFSMENPDFSIGWSLELLKEVFTKEKGDTLGPVKTPKGIQVLRITDRRPANIPDFEKARDRIKERFIDEKTRALAREKAENVLTELSAKLAAGTGFEAVAKELGLEVKTTPFFSLGEYLPEIGISEDFESAAAGLSKENPLSKVVTTSRGPAIMHWESTTPADEKKYEEVRKDFTDALYREKHVAAMNAFIKELREKAGLTSYLEKKDQK